MKYTYIAILLGVTLLAVQGQYAVPSVHDECESSCSSTDSNCCGCCGSDSTCSGNAISKRCCPANSGFCGCISNRAFCSGSVFNSSRVNGTDSFGSCFDTSAATCTYDPNPNFWIVCPATHTPCKSSSFFSCCGPDTECTTSSIDSYPICAPKASAPVEEEEVVATSAEETQPDSGLAVPSENASCQAECSSSNSTCCGCCSEDASCFGNAISRRCCPANSGFCGCISNRAYCSGYVYNSSGPVDGKDSFGSCFDVSSGATCSYNPNPNLWVVCPKDYNACESASFFSCCAPDTVCTTSSIDSYPICAPKASQSTVETTPATSSEGDSTCVKSDYCPSALCSCNGACYSEDEYCCPNGQLTQKSFCPTASTPAAESSARPAGGAFVDPTPEAFSTVFSGQQFTFTYQSPTTPPGNVYILFLGPASLGNGALTGNPFVKTVTVPSSLATGLYNLTFIEQHNGQGPSDYSITTSRPLYVSNVAASSTVENTPATSSASSCEKSDYCPSTLCSCNGACYSEDQYCCPNGQLTQKAFC